MAQLPISDALTPDDYLREQRINDIHVRLADSCDTHERVLLWDQLRGEIGERSPEAVRVMEIERGLR